MELKIGARYRHYKGKEYRVLHEARHSETLEWMVVYECLYPNSEGLIWIRPKSMFLEDIELDGGKVPRFSLLD
jgi:hypothetical protein